MKTSFLKNLGIILVVLGALLAILGTIIPAMSDLLDQNWYTVGSAVLVVIGLLCHIFLNKYLPLDDECENCCSAKASEGATEILKK